MKKTVIHSALAAAFAIAGAANAAVISFSDSIPLTTTNWTDAFTLSKFDSSLGTLTSVRFSYGGTVETTARVESLDAQPATVTANSRASITLGGPVSDVLTAAGSANRPLSAFDGAIDFGGTSGFDFGTVLGSDSDTMLLTAGLNAFIGIGTYDISVDALGQSTASGAGNLVAAINTRAGAQITVDYTYDALVTNVPEPGVLALLGLGLLGVAFSRRRAA